MKIAVFCGPSMTVDAGRAVLPGATFMGPAKMGDVYLAVERGAEVIALCDGYFEHELSVWHKEILWALAHGVHVYGASSMGALRAAELASFGMTGVGWVFEQFRDGKLEDDDEVAVVHEAADRGFAVRSDALVNIRATLERAVTLGVLSRETSNELVSLAKRTFYAERTYLGLLDSASAAGINVEEVHRLRDWLASHGPVDQKRLDAASMLEVIATHPRLETSLPNHQPTFHFEYTDAWHALRTELDRSQPQRSALWSEAIERALALALAEADSFAPEPESVQARSEEIRDQLSLFSPEETADWLSRNELDVREFSLIVYRELMIERYREKARDLATTQLRAVKILGGRRIG